MKRFHVHVSVSNLEQSIGFYATLFGVDPTVRKPDYAKWMLDDPRINFAISERGRQPGVNHLGFQVDDESELETMHSRLVKADGDLIQENDAACCYARSDKYWVTDPQGIAWETFRTLGSAPVYGEDTAEAMASESATACCVPTAMEGPPAPSTCGPAPAAKTGCCAAAP